MWEKIFNNLDDVIAASRNAKLGILFLCLLAIVCAFSWVVVRNSETVLKWAIDTSQHGDKIESQILQKRAVQRQRANQLLNSKMRELLRDTGSDRVAIRVIDLDTDTVNIFKPTGQLLPHEAYESFPAQFAEELVNATFRDPLTCPILRPENMSLQYEQILNDAQIHLFINCPIYDAAMQRPVAILQVGYTDETVQLSDLQKVSLAMLTRAQRLAPLIRQAIGILD